MIYETVELHLQFFIPVLNIVVVDVYASGQWCLYV